MAQVNLSGHSGKQTETLEEPQCVAGRAHEIHLPVIFLAATNIILSINAFHGNTPFIRHPNLCFVLWQRQISYLSWPDFTAFYRYELAVFASRRMESISMQNLLISKQLII